MSSKLKHAHISKQQGIVNRLIGMLIVLGLCTCAAFASPDQPNVSPDSSLPSVRGNRTFSDAQIVSLLRDAGWRAGERSAAIGALQNAYFSEGYIFATFLVEEQESGTVLIVNENAAASYGSVRIRGVKGFDEANVRRILGIKPGSRFNPRELSERIEELLKHYDDAGFPFAQVWVDSLGMNPDNRAVVDIGFYVIEGGKKNLRSVGVEGLVKTREDLVVRLSGLKSGEPYTGESIEDAYLNLQSSGIFEEVSYPQIKLSPDGNGVEAVLLLKEPRRTNSFSSALGYSKAETGDDEVLSGMVHLNVLNIGGTLRDLSIFWNNDGAGKSDTKLSYKDRFIFGRSLSFGVTIEQTGLDTLYTWQSVGVQVGRPFGRIGGSLITLKGALYADRNVFSEGDLLRSWRVRMAAGFSFLTGRPGRSTFNLDGRFTLARKKFYSRSQQSGQFLSQYIVDVKQEVEVDFTRTIHLKNETAYSGLESNEALVPLSEQFYLGGARTLRGYQENQFHGRRIAYSRWELVIGRRTVDNAYLFTDGGYILQETASPAGGVDRRHLLRSGYGFGLRTASKLGRVDISFGVGEKLSLRQTKVHVILEQTF